MYHPYKKNSSYLRNAIYKVHKGQCIYCGTRIEPRYMHVDHILPSNRPNTQDDDVLNYMSELERDGFVQDSIENYVPTCSACNIKKSNLIFNASNLRYYHEMAKRHVNRILEVIETEKKHEEYIYEPVDLSVWEEVDFSYQRNISYAVMGYRLTYQDVESCPVFPQVEKTEKQLRIVDYVIIQGETGCGKSISLFQVAYRFYKKGWKVYLLRNSCDQAIITLPDNTENSLYLVDDAQLYSNYFMEYLERQSRPYRKVLIAKTVTDQLNTESIVLTNRDSVNVLYRDFLRRKNEILPVVKNCDKNVGVNMDDIPIERRLAEAKKATTPWQFSYILRGGWKTMKDIYLSICNHNNCDLLAASIATFQILKLDNNVDFDYICRVITAQNPAYHWTKADLQYLIDKKIVLSEDDIRIVHLESAHVIVYLFFDCIKTDKQRLLLSTIEREFNNKKISPLGFVWLCNGCRFFFDFYYSAEELFLTDAIVNGVESWINKELSSEEVRNTLYLLEKIISSDREQERGFIAFKENKGRILELISSVDSVSAWGYGTLFNTIYNHDKKEYRSFSKRVNWGYLMDRFIQEDQPNYYSWGRLFNRGLSLTGKKNYSQYSDKMFSVLEKLVKKSNTDNIEKTTSFFCDVIFLNYERTHELMPLLMPIYKKYFEDHMEKAIHLFDFDFNGYICGISLWEKRKPSNGQSNTAKMLINVIPNDKLAEVISIGSMQEWYSIRDILTFIFEYDKDKYVEIIRMVNLESLSMCTKESWSHSHEIGMIIDILYEAGADIAQKFIRMNISNVECFYSIIIAIDAQFVIKNHKDKGIPLELFTAHWWGYSLAALKAMVKADSDFSKEYINANISQIAERYSNVCALDFDERYSLDLLKLILKIDPQAFNKIKSLIDKEKILDQWDRCGGFSPRKKQWIAKRKKEFFDLIS